MSVVTDVALVPSLTRSFDLLDVALANAMLAVAALPPVTVVDVAPGRVRVSADAAQVGALRDLFWQTEPAEGEAWMKDLAPRLVDGVVEVVGADWLAEAELSVELALALRADDMADLANALADGAPEVDASRSAAATIAADVPDPSLVLFM